MPGKEPAEITVAANGAINVAPYADDLEFPVDADSPLADEFVDLGYASEDGVTFTATPNVEGVPAWQSATDVRRIIQARELTLASALEQWNRDTFGTAFGGGTWSTTGTAPDLTHRYDPPADQDPLAEFAVVIDAEDGMRLQRWVVMKCNITEAVETQLVRTGAALLPVTFNALTPAGASRAWYFLSNDPAFASA